MLHVKGGSAFHRTRGTGLTGLGLNFPVTAGRRVAVIDELATRQAEQAGLSTGHRGQADQYPG